MKVPYELTIIDPIYKISINNKFFDHVILVLRLFQKDIKVLDIKHEKYNNVIDEVREILFDTLIKKILLESIYKEGYL